MIARVHHSTSDKSRCIHLEAYESKMELENGEKILLKEATIGKGIRGRTLALTNRRLLFLKKDEAKDEIRIEEISEVYPHTDEITEFTTLKIRLEKGTEITVHWKGGGMLKRLFDTKYHHDYVSSITSRYVNAINKLMNMPPRTSAGRKRKV